jgi:hypothetical protein
MEAGMGEHEAAIDRLAPVTVPTGATVGERVIGRVLAAVERGLTRMESRRRRRVDARRRGELTDPWTAGMSRGLTLFVGDPRPAPRRGREDEV